MVRGREVPSFIGAKPETRATALKKHVISAFAPGQILNYEHIVNNTMEILMQQLEKHGPVVDLVEWLRYFMFDTLSRIAFSEDLGFMANREDVDGTLAGAQDRFDHWHYWLAVPQPERLLFKNPIVLKFAKPSSRLAALALRKINARHQQAKGAGEFHDLLSHYLGGEPERSGGDRLPDCGWTDYCHHSRWRGYNGVRHQHVFQTHPPPPSQTRKARR